MRDGERMDGKRTGWKRHRARGDYIEGWLGVTSRYLYLYVTSFWEKINNRPRPTHTPSLTPHSHHPFHSIQRGNSPPHFAPHFAPQFAPAFRSSFRPVAPQFAPQF